MPEEDTNRIIRIYTDLLNKHGVSPKALGWNKKRANLRFEIFTSQWNLDDLSILDFGCGFGDFYHFLTQKNIRDFKYLGIDLNPRFIEIAKSKYPNASFKVLNIFKESLKSKYDYIFASGVFNDKLHDNQLFIKNVLDKFNKYSLKGFAANFLSNKVQYRRSHTFHADPSKILNLCYNYSNNIILRNDYMPFEFSIFVNKVNKYNSKIAVYDNFKKYL